MNTVYMYIYNITHYTKFSSYSSPPSTSTCFYSLCLISKTPQGADALLTHGWTSVRHSSDEKWPLILSEAIEDVIHIPSSPLSPSTSFNGVMSVIDERGRTGNSPNREGEKRRQSSPSHNGRDLHVHVYMYAIIIIIIVVVVVVVIVSYW